jgi:hypothetical protein
MQVTTRKERRHQYYLANREKILAQRRAYHAAHRGSDNAAGRAWRLANQEKVKALNQSYHTAHKEQHRAYKAANRERFRGMRRAWDVAHREQKNAAARAWNAANREKIAAGERARRYGLTPAAFESMKAVQQNRCAICGEEVNLCVDHDHATGKVRALLCRGCNHGLGNFKDSETALLAAAGYVRKYRLIFSQDSR